MRYKISIMLPTQQQVIDYVLKNPGCMSKAIAKHFGCTSKDINRKRNGYCGVYYLPGHRRVEYTHYIDTPETPVTLEDLPEPPAQTPDEWCIGPPVDQYTMTPLEDLPEPPKYTPRSDTPPNQPRSIKAKLKPKLKPTPTPKPTLRVHAKLKPTLRVHAKLKPTLRVHAKPKPRNNNLSSLSQLVNMGILDKDYNDL
jgi:hypothetical protein